AHGYYRRERRHGASSTDGSPSGRGRGLRQDGDSGAGRVQGGAIRPPGGGAGADDDSGRPARANIRRTVGRFSGQRGNTQSIPDAEGAGGGARGAQGWKSGRRDRHASSSEPRRRILGARTDRR